MSCQKRTFFLRLAALALLLMTLCAPLPHPFSTPFLPPSHPVDLPKTPRLLALTFDDGPKSTTTAPLLDGLAQRGVHATFFLIGKQIEENQDLVLRMAAEGHQVGIHTWDHVALQGLSHQDFDAQIQPTQAALTALLGQGDLYLRPPYGQVDANIRAWAGRPIILWSVDPEDWRKPPAEHTVHAILETVRDGDIILLHDIFPQSVDAALTVVDQLQQEGWTFVTVEELFYARGIAVEKNAVYRRAAPE